ncbi:MAG: cadherin-like domain-containing protein [Spirulina sp.]
MANYPSPLIVVDSQVDECWRLMDELGGQGSLRVIQADEDGVAVITEALGHHPTDTLIVVAHGAPGRLSLGNTHLDLDSLDRYTEALGHWFATDSSPQIYLYGCQVAAGDAGAEFLARIHHLTGAGVAASPRLVGHGDLGGDWRLDTTVGQVSPRLLVGAALAAQYRAVLGTDNFAGATVWTPSTNTGTTVGATHQLGEPIHDPNVSGLNQSVQESLNNSIWWQWTATTTGLITLDTIGSALNNTVLAVYTGGSVNSLNQVAFNDNISGSNLKSQVTFTAVAGTTYYFAVDGVGSATGAVQLNLNTAPQITPNQVFNINEHSANGVAVGTVTANEPGLTWSLVSGNPDNDNDGNRAFLINASTGAITVNDADDLNFETFATAYNLLVRATDAGGLSNEQLVTVNILDVNEAPIITGLTTNQSSINEGGQITVSGSFRDADADDLHTVTISWGDGTSDVIGGANLAGPDADGNFSFANLRHTYQDNATYTITMTVEDASGLTSAPRTVAVVVNNVPPTITQGATLAISVNEDSPTTFTLNATDPGRLDTLTWDILNQASNGTASVSTSPTGRNQIISYLPNPDFAGTDTFEVQVADNNGGFDTIVVNVTVVPQPDPPRGLNILGDVATINEGDTFTLTGIFSDPDLGDTFTVTINWGDGTPAVVLSNGDVTNLGNGNYRFTTSHTYLADSGAGAFSISAIVRDSANLTVSDTLSLPVANVAPSIVQGAFLALSTDEDTPLTFDLDATDPADTTFQWSVVAQPPNGTVTFVTNPNGSGSQTLVFTPAANFDQNTSFDVQVSDGNGGVSIINVLVDVEPVNDDPTSLAITPDFTTINEGSSISLTGSFTDVDSGDSHTVTIDWGDGTPVTTLAATDLTLAGTTYTLPARSHTYADEGNYTVTVMVEDAAGAMTSRTQAITVNNVAPTITDAGGTAVPPSITLPLGQEDTPILFSLGAQDPGVTDTLQWRVSAAPNQGTVTILPAVAGQPQEFRYTPNPNVSGADFFTLELSDGDGGVDTVVVNLFLDAVNDLPVITANQFTITEGQPLLITQANLNATDIETFDPNLAFEITGLATGERFAVAGGSDNFFNLLDVIEGRVTFIDDGNETRPAFSITVRDGSTGGVVTTPANITFIPVNDAPVIGNRSFTVTEGQPTLITSASLSATDEELALTNREGELQYTITRIEGGVIQVSGTTQTTFTQADIDGGRVTFVHGGEDIVPVLEYTVSDGLLSTPSSAVVTFINVNDPPRILANSLTLTEGDVVTITLQNIDATDPDNDDNTLIFDISGLNPAAGTFERRASSTTPFSPTTTFSRQDILNGNVRFVHSGNEVAPAYTLTVRDAEPLTASGPATVSFTTVNDIPIFGTNTLTIDEGQTLVLSGSNIATSDEETPATGLTYTVSGLSGGRFELVANPGTAITSFTQDDIDNSRVQFVHNGDEAAPTYTLTVSDGVNEVESEANIVFTNLNDAPNLINNRLTITEGQTRLITTTDINASDVEDNDNTLTFVVGQIAASVFVENDTFAGGEFQLKDGSGVFVKTSRFTREDIINQRVRFVHNGTETRPTYAIQVLDSDGGNTFRNAEVTFTSVNDLPVVQRNRLIIEEEGAFLFNADPLNPDLVTTDEETLDKTQIVYTVTAVTAGQFEDVSNAGVAITSFTQQQLDDQTIRFVHNGTEETPSYTLSVSDSTGGVVTSNGNVTFTNVNDAPTFTANSFDLTEGGTLVLSTANINATDVESLDTNLRFDITAVTGGRFERVSAPGTAILSFTLGDIILGDIQFTQPPADEETPPTYTITVTDDDPTTPRTTTQVGTVNFTPINDAPTIVANTLTIAEGGTVIFGDGVTGGTTGGVLRASDPETPAGELRFEVSSVVGGQFELTSTPGTAVFSFTQAQVTANQVRFVQNGTSVVPNYTVTVKDPQDLTGTGTPTVTFTDVNDPPAITRNTLTITEGQTVVLGSANLQYSDEESSPAQVTYTVTGVTAGQFERVATPGTAITSFTQAEVNAGAIQFVHNGTETPPTYTLTLTDGGSVSGAPLTTAPSNATIDFSRVNDRPTIGTNTLTIAEEGSVVLNALGTNLTASDEETAVLDLVYVVDAVTNGRFELTTAPGTAITTFTQVQLNSGEVRFVHDPASGETPPTYTLRAQDSEGALSDPSDATITFNRVNDNPVFSVNALTITEGTTVTLTTANLLSSDEEDGVADLTYSIVGTVTGGKFVLASDPTQTAITSFTQAQVEAAAIQFVHDGTETAPAYTLRVTDSETGFAERSATITFEPVNDDPVFSVNTLTLNEGQTVVLGIANLLTEDEESGDADLTYQVQSVTNGRFERVATPGTAITSFSQDDVANGRVQFVHSGSEQAPTYTLVVTDGDGATVTRASTINFTNLNDPPTFQASNLTVTEGATVTLDLSNINATDPDHPDDQIVYSVTNVVGGSFFFNGAALTPATTFNAVDLSLGRLTFVDDGNNAPPTFDLVATDPDGDATTVAATVTFTALNDAPVLAVNQFTITEGQPLVLSDANLRATDEETTDPTRLIYRVRNVTGGGFFTIPDGDEVFTFTQAQINAGNEIVFRHDGSETTPAFTLEVTDPNGGTSGQVPAVITYNRVNDAPVFSRNVLTIAEGQTVVLSTSDITVSDIDTPLSLLTFTVDTVQNGFFTVDGTVLAAGDTFTRTQLVLGQVSFTASDDGLTPAYTLTVNDNDPLGSRPATRVATVNFTPVNDLPQITVNNFPITEGRNLELSTANLDATDEETTNRSQLVYTVSGLQGGVFFNVGTGSNVTSFSQLDVDNRLIFFRHNGSETPAAFTLSLADGSGGTTVAPGNVIFTPTNDPPVLSINAFPVTEGGTLKLSATNLSVVDPDNTPAQLRYTVGGLAGGQFSRDTNLDGVPDAPGITTFSQQDVLDGLIFFVHDGNEAAPSFTLTLTDGTVTLPAVPANVTFTRVNDAPESVVLTLSTTTINEGSAVILNGTFVDVDSTVHTVTVNWGNGTTTTIPTSQIVNNGGGNFSLPAVNRTYADDGVFVITVTVNDGQATAQGTTTVTVNDVPPTIALSGSGPVKANSPYTLTIGTPVDPGDDQYVAFQVDWGDGTTSTATQPGDVTKVYKAFGTYTITVTAIDNQGQSFSGGTETATILYPITDFTGNGLPDVFWRFEPGVDNVIWTLDASGNLTNGLPVRPLDSAFSIQSVADFNNDGRNDVFWRNSASGDMGIWLMDGATVQGGILLPVVDPTWSIVGFTDFNNDGSQDVLWRNVTGANVIWTLQAGELVDGVVLPSLDPSFEMAALTDINQNGFDDIVWRNPTTGQNLVWLMNGTTFSSDTNLTAVDPAYDLVATADFTGDGIEDFVWQHQFAPAVVVWEMGPNGTIANGVLLPALDPAYELRGATDLNGDNQTDLLWRNPTTGDTFAWAMNGTTVASTIDYPDPPAGWQVYV